MKNKNHENDKADDVLVLFRSGMSIKDIEHRLAIDAMTITTILKNSALSKYLPDNLAM